MFYSYRWQLLIRLGDYALFSTNIAFIANFEYLANNDRILGFKCPSKSDFRDFFDHFLIK